MRGWLLAVIAALLGLMIRRCDAGLDHDSSRVVWVPIMERRTEMTAAIGDALKAEVEKSERIGKMLNNSLTTKEAELAQGSKKLHVLQVHQQQNGHNSSPINSASTIGSNVIGRPSAIGALLMAAITAFPTLLLPLTFALVPAHLRL